MTTPPAVNSDDRACERLPWWVVVGLAAALSIVAFLLFVSSLSNRFVNWDDPVYVLYNPGISHLDWESLTRRT